MPIYDDIRQVTADRLIRDGIRPDVITGGFPCQDLSAAGKQAGIDGERSGLWAELARLIGELQPRYAIMENVTNLISGDSGRWFGRVLGDLAEVGYDAEWHCIPASAIGAHHHRDRVWILAHPSQRERQPRAEEQGILRTLPQDGAIDSDPVDEVRHTPRHWPTPAASDYKGAPKNRYWGSDTYRSNLREAVRENQESGQLNPAWVEWLMGFPNGHTDLKH